MRSQAHCTPLLVCMIAIASTAALLAIPAASVPSDPATMSRVDGTTKNFSGSAVVVAPDLVLSSGDNIDAAIVSIGSGFNDGGTDALDVDGTLPNGITSSYDATSGVLTFDGIATPADYQAAFRLVTFATTASVPGTAREITFSLGGAIPNPDNGHFYLFFSNGDDEAPTWTAARTAASASTYYGRTGYLATVTSGEENAFVFSKSGLQGWIGASDDPTYTEGQGEGDWRWATGPESGTQFWSGNGNGNPVGGRYNNWDEGEPNNCCDGEHYAHFLTDGYWNDFANDTPVDGYYVEYGGMPGDTTTTTSGTATVTLGGGATMIAIRNVHKKNVSDQLCSIPDLETGVPEVVGNLGAACTVTKSIAVLPAEEEVARGNGTSRVVDDRIFVAEEGVLYEVDPATGAATAIGAIGWPDVTGLAFHPETRVLYGITLGTNKLLTIDTETGAGTVVANRVLQGYRLSDMAFAPNGDLYVVIYSSTTARVYEISPTTGKKIARWDLTGGTSLEALLWSEDGETLYSAATRNGYKDLCTIDLDAKTVNFVGTASSNMRDVEGLAWFNGDLGAAKPVVLVDDGPEDVEDPDEILGAGDGDGTDDEIAALPVRLALLGNVPNPFNPSTRIEYELPIAGDVRLAIYDVAGRHVATLAYGRAEAGRHVVTWDGRSDGGSPVASGVYFCRLQYGSEVRIRSLTLME